MTIGIAFYTAKTYYFQSKRASELFCKSIEKDANRGTSNLYIEIYNYGNDIAKDISVNIQETDFCVIPFLKPLESFLIPIGYIIYASGNRIISSRRIKITSDTDIVNVKISVGRNIKNYEVNIRSQIQLNTTRIHCKFVFAFIYVWIISYNIINNFLVNYDLKINKVIHKFLEREELKFKHNVIDGVWQMKRLEIIRRYYSDDR